MIAAGASILRREVFGAALYSRARAAFALLPEPLWRLLVDAGDKSVLETWARAPHGYGIAESELVHWVGLMRRHGDVDEGFRFSAQIVERAAAAGALSAPLLTHVQLTRACNLSCAHCFVDVAKRPAPDELSTAQLLSLFAELSSLGAPLVVLAGGEPMARKDFFTLVDGIGRHGIDASLCTNGTLIDEARAERLASSAIRWYSVSLDGPDEETHALMRGPGSFARALGGVRHLVAAGARDVQLRVTVTRLNAHRLLDFARVALEVGAHKVAFKPFRMTETGAARSAAELSLDRRAHEEAMARVRDGWPAAGPRVEVGDGVPVRAAEWTGVMPAFGCVGGTTSASVMYDGRVVACGFVLTDDDWSLHERSFAECWGAAPTLTAWRRLEGGAACTTSCESFRRCGGGCRARALGAGRRLSDPDPWADCSLEERAPSPAAHVRRGGLPVVG